jgi:transketolase C-terminal domain/subunit
MEVGVIEKVLNVRAVGTDAGSAQGEIGPPLAVTEKLSIAIPWLFELPPTPVYCPT